MAYLLIMRKFAGSPSIAFPSLKSIADTTGLSLFLFFLFIFFFFLFVITNMINPYDATKKLCTIQIICRISMSASCIVIRSFGRLINHFHSKLIPEDKRQNIKNRKKYHTDYDSPTARIVLLWSSYARKAKPLDLPVALSLTRLTSTISPYLPLKGKQMSQPGK